MKIPKRIRLANLPTRIEKLDKLTQLLGGPDLYIKRDDHTGIEVSGNKIRKLEFAVKEAIEMGCDYLITCGGIQSNHARATAAVAVKTGMKCCLVLRGSSDAEIDGNLFIEKLLGADVRFITSKEYKLNRMEIMEEIKHELEGKGFRPYVIPEGASNGIGTFGYYNCFNEIVEQEKVLGVHFDAICVATGSGGTQAGLILGNKLLNNPSKIFGINVCDDEEYFKNKIYQVLQESSKYLEKELELERKDINILDGYVGKGYALSRPEELNFIREFARLEGIILDPVYTGKAMYGITEEIKKGSFKTCKNLLFIHTGGLFGLFPQKKLFGFDSNLV